MFTRDLTVTIHADEVLHRMDCYQNSDLYEEILEEYQEIEEEMYRLCEPVLLFEYAEIGPELMVEGLKEGTRVLMVLYSVGGKLSNYSTMAFAKGDYVKGMMADAIADTALFSLRKEILPFLKEACEKLQLTLGRKLEPPHDIPIQTQRTIWEATKALEQCGIDITSGYMLNPVKSHAEVYVLSEEQEIVACKVYDADKMFTLQVRKEQSILDALMEADNSFSAVCGGKGRCGKCKIKVLEGELPVTTSDKECFSEQELQAGMRLSCKAYPKAPLSVEINFKGESNFQVMTEYVHDLHDTENVMLTNQEMQTENYGIAIDIGTTTIAIQLISLITKKSLGTYTTINHQRSLGADVISRIKASTDGKKEELRLSIQNDLVQGIRHLIGQLAIEKTLISEVMISGNTTMIHLLMGYDCKSLGEYPFTPVNIKPIESTYQEVFHDEFLSAKVRIVPGISTFVGGDITSGLYSCGIDSQEEYSLLIDLGTNGEMALGNKDKILVTSTAAGPAFEGGNIVWGVGSLEGAISGVTITAGVAQIQTLGNKPPIGICGTGVIETVAELMKAELVDETGCLDDEYFDDGYPLAISEDGKQIVFTQQDVREIQLAKAAIRAGMETLFLRYGISKEQISHVYLAGGFGFKLDCQKAVEIGMIPAQLADKVEAIGNSSLGGAVKCLLSSDGWQRMERIGKEALEINLSADKAFNQFYMDYMYLEKDE